VIKIPDKNNWREGLILAHSFTGVSPLWQGGCGEKKSPILTAKNQRVKNTGKGRTRNSSRGHASSDLVLSTRPNFLLSPPPKKPSYYLTIHLVRALMIKLSLEQCHRHAEVCTSLLGISQLNQVDNQNYPSHLPSLLEMIIYAHVFLQPF
jgi:hypothetical protein